MKLNHTVGEVSVTQSRKYQRRNDCMQVVDKLQIEVQLFCMDTDGVIEASRAMQDAIRKFVPNQIATISISPFRMYHMLRCTLYGDDQIPVESMIQHIQDVL